MKNIMKYLSALLAAVLISTTFSSCAEDDDNGSAHVGLGIKVFFPTKVVTNQPMTINGSGFSAATEIEFPGGVKVTNFELVSDDMIRLNAPSGIAADGGKIIVRTADAEAESRLPLTLGHTKVSGFDKQPEDEVNGGDLITVYGTDLEFVNSVELLDAEGEPQMIDHSDFYRKGTNNLIFRIPLKNIYEGSFEGKLHTFDGQSFTMPMLAYKPAADDGHWETVKTTIWKNGGTLGEISWSGDYRFAPESNTTGEECYAVPTDIWQRMKTETIFVTVKGASPQIRVTSGWWSTNFTADDIMPGNELLADNGDGTFTLTLNLADNAALVDLLDAQHLLFTGSGYTVEEIYFAEEVWVDGPGMQEVKVPVWTNGGKLGEISWSGDYRFAPESNTTGEECYAVPLDIWERMKTETFYVTVKGASPQIRVTSGWWSTTWTGGDIQPGNELLTDNGDGTFKLTVNLAGDPLLDVIDAQHLLFTGSGYTVEEIYFIEMVAGGGGAKETDIWKSDGSHGTISWTSDYRFAPESNSTGEEIYAVPQDVWEKMKAGKFYLQASADADWYNVRVTTGWWDPNWNGGDIGKGDERIILNDDGTFCIELDLTGDATFVEALDARHLLFTGEGYTPLRLFFRE